MDDLRIPDRIGEVSGWRAWRIVGTLGAPRLQSVNAAARVGASAAIWGTDEWFYARCPKGHTAEIPVESCSCGLYAARDRDHLIDLHYGAYGNGQIMAVGEVFFAGKVIKGAQGWRGERGRIASLVVPYEYWQFSAPLEQAYNVPVDVGFLFSPDTRQKVIEAEARERERNAAKEQARAQLDPELLERKQLIRLVEEYREREREREEFQRGDR